MGWALFYSLGCNHWEGEIAIARKIFRTAVSIIPTGGFVNFINKQFDYELILCAV